MAVPLSQMATVTKYVLSQKLSGVKRYPLVLMLEPLFRCNLACAGCGKIQYPDHVLDKRLTPEQCLGCGGGMRRPDRQHSRRRTDDPSRDAEDCPRAG